MWHAYPAYPNYLRSILEKTINAYLSARLDKPATSEVFTSIEDCKNRLVKYSLT